MALLVQGNKKVGKAVYTFSLPAKTTCPGRTVFCQNYCYGLYGHFGMANVQASTANKLKETEKADFVANMIAEITKRGVNTLRIHVTGDFYNTDYIEKWINIATACPSVTFYAYTRSWRVAEMLPALTRLAALPNFSLWLSTDYDSAIYGPPPEIPNTRVAHVVTAISEVVPHYANLVLRTVPQRRTLEKYRNGVPVCLAENGMTYRNPMTCAKCRLCIGSKTPPRRAHDVFVPARV
jgi:hypothetical protein